MELALSLFRGSFEIIVEINRLRTTTRKIQRADSLDMLADSLVYGLALFAVGGTNTRKKNIAKVSGYFQMVLAILGMAEVIRRFFGSEPVPLFG